MATSEFDYVAVIEQHAAGFADAAAGNLDARVEHCPDWSVGDLVRHLSDVHWFWATIAEERLAEPPDESRRPARVPDTELIDRFTAGAARLADVLRRTPYGDAAWTWAPAQQDVGFIARHQVQEAAVHHWDAANAAGRSVTIDAIPAADAVDEFLTFSAPSEADPDPDQPRLEGEFGLRCTDVDAVWTIADGAQPGTMLIRRGASGDVPTVTGTASDLLLWLYERTDNVDTSDVDATLLQRFRGGTYSD
jgi:uncharacterized protein (TIGR03083 family)